LSPSPNCIIVDIIAKLSEECRKNREAVLSRDPGPVNQAMGDLIKLSSIGWHSQKNQMAAPGVKRFNLPIMKIYSIFRPSLGCKVKTLT